LDFRRKDVQGIAPDKPTMNLGWVSGDSTEISDDETGVILHEFGHALGMLHEHQSPLRGEKIIPKESGSSYYYHFVCFLILCDSYYRVLCHKSRMNQAGS